MKYIGLDENNIINFIIYFTIEQNNEYFEYIGEFPLDIELYKYQWVPSEQETPSYIIRNNIIEYGVLELNPNYIQNIELPQVKATKIANLDNNCTTTIYNGMDITLSTGITEHFTLDEHDQSNLLGLAVEIMMGATQVAWHTNNTSESCKYYLAQDAQLIISMLTLHKSYHITYFRDLRIYVNSLTDIDEINNIYYGIKLPEEFKSDVLKDFERKMGI